jgi:hypothetical protein
MAKKMIQQGWTHVDDVIKEMMQTFPRLFPSRIECWIHIFGGCGTGYEWDLEKGIMYYPIEYKKDFGDKARYAEKGPYLEEFKKDDDELLVFSKQRTNMLIQHTSDNINLAVQDYHRCTLERHITSLHINGWSDPKGNFFSPGPMQQACIHRDKISKHWRYEVSYFCDWIIGEVRRFCFCPSRVVDNKSRITDEEIIEMLEKSGIRKLYEMKTAFKTALKVKEDIFTDEEKEKHRKNHEEMMKWTEKMVKKIKEERDKE